MYDNFIAYINRQLTKPLTEEEIEIIKSAFTYKKLRKHQYLLQEGEVCKMAGFVIKGALKQYTIDKAGKENIIALLIDNWWAGDRESFVKDEPSAFYIDAFEETEMFVFTKNVYNETLSHQPFFKELLMILSEKHTFRLLKRIHATNTQTAEQRLMELENSYPAFFQKFPQHIIASYLGMTKETLSRIRANAAKR